MTDNSNCNHDDTESEMQPLGTARTAPAALEELKNFVAAAKPQGKSAKALFSRMKKNAEAWRSVMDNQQWQQLSEAVGRELKSMRKSEDAGAVDDAPLLIKLDGYLDTLQKAAKAAE